MSWGKRIGIKAAGAASAVAMLLAMVAPAAQAAEPETTPEPAWRLSLTPITTNFVPGATGALTPLTVPPIYHAAAFNVGGKATEGSSTIEMTLPAGITPVNARGGGIGGGANFVLPACSIAGQVVTCSTPSTIKPSRSLFAEIAVQTSPIPGDSVAEATVSGGGADPVTTLAPSRIDATPAAFDLLPGAGGLRSMFTRSDGSVAQQAGSHPYQVTVDTGFTTVPVPGSFRNSEQPRDISTELPSGLVINPEATPVKCTEKQLEMGAEGGDFCPDASQVGIAVTTTVTSSAPQLALSPVYNVAPPPGVPAQLAFEPANIGIYVHLQGELRSDGDYGISGVVRDTIARAANPILGVQVHLWGDPSSSEHDNIRGACRAKTGSDDFGVCPVEPQSTPFVTMPSACSETLPTTMRVNSWEKPGTLIERTVESVGPNEETTEVVGCSTLEFDPTLTVQPDTSAAEAPSAITARLHVPQNPSLGERATANLKDAKVTFPAGVALNPAAAAGLEACATEQIGLRGTEFPAPSRIRFTNDPAQCPDAAKIGTVEVKTPLLDHPLPGSLYVAAPYENPFGTLLAVYIVIDDPQSGIVAKLAGKTEADPVTGQLTTTFAEGPQVPFEDFTVKLFGGPRAALRTPVTCGTFTTHSELAPWSGTPAVSYEDSFKIERGANGGPCVTDEAQMPNSPGFGAGTLTPLAGSFSPFHGRLQRNDGEQQIKALSLTLPPGLSGKLAGVATCSEAAIAAADARPGTDELQSPSCPSASQIGEVRAGAGAGSTPYYTNGKIYLAGPYKGAPLSAAVVIPAVAGPFDLGTVVVRAAAQVDPVTAQITVDSDPAPRILEGIPLQVRDIQVQMSRPEFTINPTSCDQMSVGGEAISVLDQVSSLAERFQVGGCRGLEFEPKLFLRLKGGTKRGGHPSLRAVLSAKGGEANIAKTIVALPRSAFLDQSHIRTVCTRVQFAADSCPKGAIYGQVKATTPLLDEALEGPVYLRSSSNELPDMVAVLKGPPSRPIQIETVARIDSIRGGIRANFETIPDAPISKVIVTMQGGRKGLLINSRNLCKSTNRATVQMDSHSGKTHDFRPVVKAKCKARAKKQRRNKRR